ncbi:NAD-dependent epimerase/dehydratase family protein [Kutzneria chonburiensis]|uniref:NAD-dependent epimerase/dehydratase family protein n=1 Tax=Kutzneria chonburiensis TaxID=1483604 RepID=A0ABV6N6P6_9PSEU|nr:NAD-dependent epimerase/dehydratase family protein [Kutzneria chonburiensis]
MAVQGEWDRRRGVGAVLVTGATGFVGSAMMTDLLSGPREHRPEIRVLTRSGVPHWMSEAGVVEVRGDLVEPSTMRGACDGVTTVLHLGSQIGGSADLCDAVNRDGTRVLLEEATRAGVNRFVYLSTTSVYGSGVHRGSGESLLAPAPASPTSASKLAAERSVRSFGGVVLRPHLVYGAGDIWFVPTLLRLLEKIPALIDSGGARTSVVAVTDLARVIAALARMAWGRAPGAVFHVSDPRPVRMRELIGLLCARLGHAMPEESLPAPAHRELTRQELPSMTDHQFELLAYDHFYDSERIWRHTGVRPGPGVRERIDAPVAQWYRERVAA